MDSLYHDDVTSTNNQAQASTSAQAAFEAEAARLRARMPYRPPSPSSAPLSSSSYHALPSSSQFNFPSLVRNEPTSRPPNQMSREGPIPRAPGAPREPDFYERLTPRNQRLFKLYGAAALCGVIEMASVVYSWWNIYFERVFSEKAKGVMLGVYGWSGYGGLLMILIPALSFTLLSLRQILSQSLPIPEICSAITSVLSSALLLLFGLLSFFKIRNQGQSEAQDGQEWDACLAPGADKWKRLPCGAAKDEVWLVQMSGLGVLGVASVLYFILFLVHLTEAKANGGSLFSRQKGYVRLEQNSLNPYEIHEQDDEDEEPRGRFRPSNGY